MPKVKVNNITREEYTRIYTETNGCSPKINPNSPPYGSDEDFMLHIDRGSDALVKENPEIVTKLI